MNHSFSIDYPEIKETSWDEAKAQNEAAEKYWFEVNRDMGSYWKPTREIAYDFILRYEDEKDALTRKIHMLTGATVILAGCVFGLILRAIL